MEKIAIIFGTRPEFIKLIPLITEIKKRNLQSHFLYIYTQQHKYLDFELFHLINFTPDYVIPYRDNFNSVSASFSYIFNELQSLFQNIQTKQKIKMILAVGDTTSVACAAVFSFQNKIRFGHIEAGLRTYNSVPFPEEYFRRIISLSASLHFAPTESAVNNLLNEGIERERIILTGNTIVDAIDLFKNLSEFSEQNILKSRARNVLITCHRRENQNVNIFSLAQTIKKLACKHPKVNFVWITHHSHKTAEKFLLTELKNFSNINVLKPLNVPGLYQLYRNINLIITDSGGIQEEACSFDIPVIVIRENTERIESIHCGYSIISRDFTDDLISIFDRLINNSAIKMENPYGDGFASMRIIDYLKLKFITEADEIERLIN